jgi:hypothetical protein
MLRFQDLFKPLRADLPVIRINLRAVTVLGSLLGVVTVLTLGFVLIPLVLQGGAQLAGANRFAVFFLAIGFGYMLIEISQMQRFSILLGRPTYSLSVVLFSLLVSSGIGSLLTVRLRPVNLTAWLAALVALLALVGWITPLAVQAFRGSASWLRIIVACLLLAGPGVLMGMAFPMGMQAAARSSAQLGPWLWGVNGAASVCASVLAVIIALWAGISASYWAGVVCYVAAAASARNRFASSTGTLPARRRSHRSTPASHRS